MASVATLSQKQNKKIKKTYFTMENIVCLLVNYSRCLNLLVTVSVSMG